jgi:hypothetical protein
MLLIDTYLGPSPIDGVGVFASADIPSRIKIWEFVPGFDRLLEPTDVARLPLRAQRFLETHGWVEADGRVALPAGNDMYMNHSDFANTHCLPTGDVITSRLIAEGEEITCDYPEFDADWEKLEFLAARSEDGRGSGDAP